MRYTQDSREYRRAPRTLNEAFGPYAKLHVDTPRHSVRAWAWALGYGAAVGVVLWLVVAIRVGA